MIQIVIFEPMIAEQTYKQRCIRCDTLDDTNICLGCNHTFCLVCLSYIAIKAESKLLSFPTSIDCTICGETTNLKSHYVQKIKTTIQNVLVPQFHETLAYSPSNSSYQNTIDKPIQQLPQFSSPQKLHGQKITGITTMNQSIDISLPMKSIPSNCSSPKSYIKQCCKMHPFEEIMFACRDCNNQFLCLKCFTDNHHQNHNIRSIKKTVELFSQQVGFNKLEISQRVELFQLAYKKLMNRKQLLNKRQSNSQQKISEIFSDIIQKIKIKEQQLLQECQKYFGKLDDEIESRMNFFKQKIEDTHRISTKIRNSNPNDNPLQFIRDCMQMQKELQQKDHSAIHILIQANTNNEILQIQDQVVVSLCRSIQKLSLFNPQPRQSIERKDLRMDTVPSIRTKSYQKPFRTEKTDPGEQQSIKQTRMRFNNLQETKSIINASPDHLSQLFSRQLSCKNLYKYKEQYSITSNEIHQQSQQSFVSSKQQSNQNKRKQRKTTNVNQQFSEKQKDKFSKCFLQKKLKKIICKNK